MNQVTLTAEQLEMIKADIKAQVIRELTGQDVRSVQERSKPLLDLWRKYRKPLFEKYGVGTYAQVWECIRKLATIRTGHRYVRDLLPSEEAEAAEFARKLLELMGVELEDGDDADRDE
jgi:hypothetical protein